MKRKSFAFPFVISLAALLLMAVPLAAQSKKVREQANALISQAKKAYEQKDYKTAADKYGQAIVLVPTNPDAHYRKGFAHFELKENQKAIDEFTLALSQGFKPIIEIYRIRYYIYLDDKNYDAALADVQKGLTLAPADLNLLNAVGEIFYERKAYKEALAAFQKASKVAPNNADIYYNMARVYFGLGDSAGQASAAETALTKGTRFPGETYYLLADARQKLRIIPGAIDAYQKAINSKPDIYQAYRNLADIYRSEHRFTDAINISRQGLRAFPGDGNIYTDLSWYYSLAGKPDDAVQAAKAGIQILPNQYAAYTNLCRAYNETSSFDLAVSACNSALRLQPDDGETYYYLGNAFVGRGQSVEATRMYTRAVAGLVKHTAANPDSSDGWYLLGNASFADKQYDKAIEAYLKCLALSPKFLKARVNLGISYTRKKNKPAAMEQYNLLLPADETLAARLKSEIDKM